MTVMKAGLYVSEKNVEVREVKKPSITTDEALIKVSYAGICGTDMMIYFGKHPRATAPLVMGHEFSGIIEDIHGISTFNVGDRVVIEPTISCGKCNACQRGQFHVCESLKLIGIDMDGGFGEYVKVPINRLHIIPSNLSNSLAALAEPAAVAVHTVRRSNIQVGHNVAILGAGPIGILIGLIAKISGANNVIISDISPYRIEKAKKLGLTAIDVRDTDIREIVKDQTNGEGADVVFEVAGNDVTAKQMVELVKIQGEIVVVSVFKRAPTVDLAKMHFKEISLTTTRCYSHNDFKTALEILSKEKTEFGSLITHELSIEELGKGFSLMDKPDEALKVLIRP